MNRTLFNFGVSAILCVLLFSTSGCKPTAPDGPDPNAADPNAVNYSMAESVPVPMLTTKSAFAQFTKASDIAVVKFGAEWCQPCRQLDPELEKLAGYFQTEGVKIAQIDIDDFGSLAKEMKIELIPHTVVYYRGNYYTTVEGYAPQELANLLHSLCQDDAKDDAAEGGDDTETTIEVVDVNGNPIADDEDDAVEIELDDEPGAENASEESPETAAAEETE